VRLRRREGELSGHNDRRLGVSGHEFKLTVFLYVFGGVGLALSVADILPELHLRDSRWIRVF
jgi:hypothetical protein